MALSAVGESMKHALSSFNLSSFPEFSLFFALLVLCIRLSQRIIIIEIFFFITFPAGASQVKWNRKNQNFLASSHDGDVRIWDKRVSDLYFKDAMLKKK